MMGTMKSPKNKLLLSIHLSYVSGAFLVDSTKSVSCVMKLEMTIQINRLLVISIHSTVVNRI